MIEKIPGENIAVYKYREKSIAAEEFVLNDNSQVEPRISENSGVMNKQGQNDMLIISPDYQAVKNLTETAATLTDKINLINSDMLSEIRRKVQDGFYLNDKVLSTAAGVFLSGELSL